MDDLLAARCDANGNLADPAGFIDAAISVVSDPLLDTRLADCNTALKALWVSSNLRRVEDTTKLQHLASLIACCRFAVNVGGHQLKAELARRQALVIEPRVVPDVNDVLKELGDVVTAKDFARAIKTICAAAGGTGTAMAGQQQARVAAQGAFVNQLAKMIGAMQLESRGKLSVLMCNPATLELRAALAEVQRSPVIHGYPNLLGDLQFVAGVLDAVRLASTDASAHGTQPATGIVNLAKLGDETKAALQGCGISIGKHGMVIVNSGTASWQVQKIFEDSLRNLSADLEKPSTRDRAVGSRFFVAGAMVNDLDGVDYFAESDGLCVPLVDRGPRKGPLSAQQQVMAFEQLQQVLGEMSPAELLALSRVANATMLTGFLQVTGSPTTPVCVLPDGTKGQLLGEQANMLRIRREGAGFIISGEFRVDDATLFVPEGKTPREGIPLTRGQNHLRFSCEVAFTPGEGVKPTRLVEFEFMATPDAWSDTYNLPHPKPTAGNHLFLLDHKAELFVKWEEFLKTEFSHENLLFVREFDALMRRKDVDYSQAEALARKFVVPQSPFEVNLPSTVQLQILDVLRTDTLKPHIKLEELLRLLALARAEIDNLAVRDSMARFTKGLETASIRSSGGDTGLVDNVPARVSGDGAGPTTDVAGAQPTPQVLDRNERVLAGYLRTLATPFLTADRLVNVVDLLTKQLADKRVPDGALRRALDVRLPGFSDLELAALRYNLDEQLNDAQRKSAPISLIQSQLNQALVARGLSNMDVKSVLLRNIKSAPPQSNMMGTIVAWLDQGAVHESAVRQALSTLQTEKLNVMAGFRPGQRGEKLAPLARDALAERHVQSARDFVAAGERLMQSVQAGGNHDSDAFAQQLAAAAMQYVNYRNFLSLGGGGDRRTEWDERADKLGAEIAERLGAMLHDGELSRLRARAGFVAHLESLGVEIPLPPPTEARPETPTGDEPPPPPPDDESLPPPPTDEPPPPPPEAEDDGDWKTPPSLTRSRR